MNAIKSYYQANIIASRYYTLDTIYIFVYYMLPCIFHLQIIYKLRKIHNPFTT